MQSHARTNTKKSIVSRDGRSYLGALLGNHGHGRTTDVAGAHAADLDIPFVAHGWILLICGGDGVAPKTAEEKSDAIAVAKIQHFPATCHKYENLFDNKP